MKKSILGIGNALIDITFMLPDNSVLEGLGLPAGSMNHVGRDQRDRILKSLEDCMCGTVPGGSAANTIVAAATLGIKCGFVGMVGDDRIGRDYIKNMVENGVESRMLEGKEPSGTSLALINSKDGERTFATYLGAALELVPEIIGESLFDGYDSLHIEGYLMQSPGVLEKIMRIARMKGMTISFDLGSYNIVERNLSLMKSLVEKYVDIVFANNAEAMAFTGRKPEEAARMISAMGEGKVSVVKLGAEGSLVYGAGELYRIGAKKVKAIDTTGAGDAYAAGFLYAYSCGAGLYECGRCGTILASEAVVELGPKIGKNGWEVAKMEIGTIIKAKD